MPRCLRAPAPIEEASFFASEASSFRASGEFSEKTGWVVLDLGCSRQMCSERALRDLLGALGEDAFRSEPRSTEVRYVFADGGPVRKADFAIEHTVFIAGHELRTETQVFKKGNTPYLCSLPQLESLGACIELDETQIRYRKLPGKPARPLVRDQSGHLRLNLADVKRELDDEAKPKCEKPEESCRCEGFQRVYAAAPAPNAATQRTPPQEPAPAPLQAVGAEVGTSRDGAQDVLRHAAAALKTRTTVLLRGDSLDSTLKQTIEETWRIADLEVSAVRFTSGGTRVASLSEHPRALLLNPDRRHELEVGTTVKKGQVKWSLVPPFGVFEVNPRQELHFKKPSVCIVAYGPPKESVL